MMRFRRTLAAAASLCEAGHQHDTYYLIYQLTDDDGLQAKGRRRVLARFGSMKPHFRRFSFPCHIFPHQYDMGIA